VGDLGQVAFGDQGNAELSRCGHDARVGQGGGFGQAAGGMQRRVVAEEPALMRRRPYAPRDPIV